MSSCIRKGKGLIRCDKFIYASSCASSDPNYIIDDLKKRTFVIKQYANTRSSVAFPEIKKRDMTRSGFLLPFIYNFLAFHDF